MIKDGGVVIVDEFTGRLMPGRRWSDGLHQAVEAKEKVKIERENQTLATITFQNYFRKYKKLSGMTGTAETEAPEFNKIYNLDVIVIPTNRPMAAHRGARPGLPHRRRRSTRPSSTTSWPSRQPAGRRWSARCRSRNPSSSRHCFAERGIKHVVLNAKYHAQEAEIVAQAGRKGNVTIATNMAGRGTDILLGGNAEHMARQQCLSEEIAERLAKGEEKFVDDADFVYFFHVDGFYRVPRADWERIYGHFKRQTEAEHEEVIKVGGLHILGTERHEARRIDNQLRGRAGRQGDPGSSRFYLSLEDDLMRIFGSDRIAGLMQRLGMEEGVPIEHGMVTRAIERAQKQVEAQNFAVRKHLLEYDDVMNKQRESVYTLRREILEGKIHVSEEEVVDTSGYVLALAEDILDDQVDRFVGKQTDPEDWDLEAFKQEVERVFGLDADALDALELDDKNSDEIGDVVWDAVKANYQERIGSVGAELFERVERDIMLQIVDQQWKDHLYSLDHLKEGIGLRGYGQRDPLVEYKKESFALFQDMKARIEEDIVRYVFHMRAMVNDGRAAAGAAGAAARDAADHEQSGGRVGAGVRRAARAGADGAAGSSDGRWRPRPEPARTGGDDVIKTVRREEPKVGRNDPCPCGSGKKYKKCHGAAA